MYFPIVFNYLRDSCRISKRNIRNECRQPQRLGFLFRMVYHVIVSFDKNRLLLWPNVVCTGNENSIIAIRIPIKFFPRMKSQRPNLAHAVVIEFRPILERLYVFRAIRPSIT